MDQPTAPPNFDKITWKCPCCDQQRLDKFIRVNTIDIGNLFNSPPGIMFINVKYCVDVPSCQQKASDRNWVYRKFFPEKFNDIQTDAKV
jgi:hypothetical protein